MSHDVGIHHVPAKFHGNQIKNTVPNLGFTDTQGVAMNSHFQNQNVRICVTHFFAILDQSLGKK